MNNKRYINLSESEITDLTHLLRTTNNHRERQRIQALLWSHQGYDRQTIAQLYQVKADTVSFWFKRWEDNKSRGLKDLARSGRPSILTPKEKKV
ncbi:Homeodomain-like domain-containing protein, partial [Arcicella aurantiaca]